ncbi:uncharacterized protein LOC144105045 [Amblyomma americanum]
MWSGISAPRKGGAKVFAFTVQLLFAALPSASCSSVLAAAPKFLEKGLFHPPAPSPLLPRRLPSSPPEDVILVHQWPVPSPRTSSDNSISHIKPLLSSPPLCGLGSCASAQATNPILFTMQVSNKFSLFAKKTSNYFLMQLLSPQCCCSIAAECSRVLRFLLLLSGDVETNPGPDRYDSILSELQKLTTGQATLISDLQDIKHQLKTTETTLADLNKRMETLELHYATLFTLHSEIDALKTLNTELTCKVDKLEARMDDAENRSRRNNLIYYNIPDTNPTETYADSEETIIRHCSTQLGFAIEPNLMERAHRLGRRSTDRTRPIIVKFTSSKTKESILSLGNKLKGTNYSIGEDFSLPVRNARKHLVAFAKSVSDKFSLRFKTLHIGPKRYIFDESSQRVKEVI